MLNTFRKKDLREKALYRKILGKNISRLGLLLSLGGLMFATGNAQTEAQTQTRDRSHSHMGKAFNTGPRQLAKLIPDIGTANFPITTKNPLAQQYFNQGMNMVYTYWWYEGERAFRQVINLDPECAMGYWGLAFAASEGSFVTGRAKEFLTKALEHREKVSDREQMYLDAYFHKTGHFGYGVPVEEIRYPSHAKFLQGMESLVQKYPDDLEAKVLYASGLEQTYGESQARNQFTESGRERAEAIYQQVLRVKPLHTGVNHYRIHLWDGFLNAKYALGSCEPLAAGASNVGHALHMPGHIYASLGMWNEAAESMEAATRVERRYMLEQGRMPYHTWNYGHNQVYLVYNLSFTGRIRDCIREAEELAYTPRNTGATTPELMWVLMGLVRGERWREILARYPAKNDPILTDEELQQAPLSGGWRRLEMIKYARGMAYLHLGDLAAAERELAPIENIMARVKSYGDKSQRLLAYPPLPSMQSTELRGLVRVAKGQFEEAREDLQDAMLAYRTGGNDPKYHLHPPHGNVVRAYLSQKRYAEAVEIVRNEWFAHAPHDGFGYALLAEAYIGLGKKKEALEAYRDLQRIWVHADADLPALARVQKAMAPVLAEAGQQPWRSVPFRHEKLDRFGPQHWTPWTAPDVTFTLSGGKTARLSDYRGKNLLLVFYLGGQCLHCLEQLDGLGKLKERFAKSGTEIVAVSTDSQADIAAFLKDHPSYALQLGSDPSLKAAKALACYDEFENLELHGTVLFDKRGRMWFFDSGSEPFTQFDVLLENVDRMNRFQSKF